MQLLNKIRQKRWLVKEPGSQLSIERISSELNIDPILANLLVQRKITDFEQAKSFFRPSLDHLHDPFLMKDMDKAVNRLMLALKSGEKILVYGDYDVDGTTSVALVYSFISSFYPAVDYYIPDRYSEGYGISFQGIDYAFENNFSLIIALDCGIKSNDKVEYANTKGVDFIICDHHLPGEILPDASAVLDPKRLDCNYPFKELSGCGIGFKLVQAYCEKKHIAFSNLIQYLDLTAISIASDIVPIVGENRVLAHFGLEQLNKNPRPGILALLLKNNINRTLTITDVVFIIGPRINAAGRISSGKKAVEMLISKEKELAESTGLIIDANNIKRKELDKSITQQALEMISTDEDLINRKTTVLYHQDWHKGVIGIVASRLTETYYRPTILLAQSNGFATGSARSVKDFDVHNAIDKCSELLEQFGGHKYAAGLTIKLENIKAFSEKFEKIVDELIDEELLIPRIEIDAKLELSEISVKFMRILKQLAPFGPENMSPVFVSQGVVCKENTTRILKDLHLKINVFQPNNPSVSFAAIGFNMAEHENKMRSGEPFDICYSIEENHFMGEVTLQLHLKDLRY
ncbi:MAG: single-stranded-DNA-specific exonuclease RecJ [Bacteroidetes bacterium]|nr:single-stranded-DNA-specific exonuclease RecJ [Bacteroidota bacterium]HET6244453.1 single-stranded-DNA-specific exonuclease RecJ [Bacteroidia bacterium]